MQRRAAGGKRTVTDATLSLVITRATNSLSAVTRLRLKAFSSCSLQLSVSSISTALFVPSETGGRITLLLSCTATRTPSPSEAPCSSSFTCTCTCGPYQALRSGIARLASSIKSRSPRLSCFLLLAYCCRPSISDFCRAFSSSAARSA